MEIINKYKLIIIGIIVGAVGGYAYWHEIGCMSGTCNITSSPVNSTLYGSLMGGLFANIFQKEEKKNI